MQNALIIFFLFTAFCIPHSVFAAIRLGTAMPNSLSAGLVGYWPLDGATTNWATGRTSDLSGNENHANIIGLSTSSAAFPGQIGQALRMGDNGDNGKYLLIGNPPALQLTGSLTISAWAYLKGNPTGDDSVILSKITNGDWSYKFAYSVDNGPIQGQFVVSGSGIDSFRRYSSRTLSKNKWYHLVGVYNAPLQTLDMYVNGVLDNGALPAGAPPSSIHNSSANVRIGHNDYSENSYFDGLLDDVRVYNRALTAGEIAQLYNLGSAKTGSAAGGAKVVSNGLVGYWPLDGATTNWATGQTADISESGNGGVLTNMSTSSSPVAGKIGQAMTFANSTNRVALDTPSSIDFSSGSFSYGAWVYALANITSSDMPISHGGASGSQAGYDMELGTSPWVAHVADGTNSFSASFGNAILGQWVHLFVVVDRSTNKYLAYLNGVLVGSTDISTLGSVSDPTRKAAIGASGTGSFPFNGKIDDVRIYNRALSAADVAQLYRSGAVKTGQSSNTVVANGLVGYWPMDGNTTNWTTSKTNDISGSGNNGTLTSFSKVASVVAGKIGQAFAFDSANNNYIDLGDILDLTGTSMSVSVWVKRLGNGGCGNNCSAGVVGKYDNTGSNLDSWVVEIRNNDFGSNPNKVVFTTLQGPSNDYAYSNSLITNNVWHHIVATYDGVNKNIYIDGKLDSSTAATGNILAVAASVQVGNTSGYFNSSGEFNGYIDDVRVYNRPLSAVEVAQLYMAGR